MSLADVYQPTDSFEAVLTSLPDAARTVELPGDGPLVYCEQQSDYCPFPIARIYWIPNLAVGEFRGQHAHKQLEQLMFCPSGSIEIIVKDGHGEATFVLDSPAKGLHLRPGLWRDYRATQAGSCLVVLASRPYEVTDYIRDYDEFLAFRAANN